MLNLKSKKTIDYDSMKQQIERELSDYVKENTKKINRVTKPEMSYKDNTISVKFKIKELSKGEILSTLDMLKEYYRKFPGLDNTWPGRYVITAKKGSDYKKGDAEDFIKIIFETGYLNCRSDDSSMISFKKETEFTQEDINAFLDLWKLYASQISQPEKTLTEKLTEMGAIVYEPDNLFTWDDIAGYDEVKQSIIETIILPFKQPSIYKKIGQLTRTNPKSNLPRAVLFEGPPGTAKTTMARIIASESEIPLIYVPIESIFTKWYGESPKRLRKIFDYSSELRKSLLFLDEIDSLSTSRDNKIHDETRKVLSVLLRKLQGFTAIENVLTIGATNRKDDLDSALLSRFNRSIKFPLPNELERAAIFSYYAKHLEQGVLNELAKITDGKSGRDIEDICTDAERIWASKIILEKETDRIIAPPSEIYLRAANLKF